MKIIIKESTDYPGMDVYKIYDDNSQEIAHVDVSGNIEGSPAVGFNSKARLTFTELMEVMIEVKNKLEILDQTKFKFYQYSVYGK